MGYIDYIVGIITDCLIHVIICYREFFSALKILRFNIFLLAKNGSVGLQENNFQQRPP